LASVLTTRIIDCFEVNRTPVASQDLSRGIVHLGDGLRIKSGFIKAC